MTSTVDILGFTSSKEPDESEHLLLDYALSVFENISTKVYSSDPQKAPSKNRLDKVKLHVISIHLPQITQIEYPAISAPILLITTSSDDLVVDTSRTVNDLKESGHTVLDSYHLPNFKHNFNVKEGSIGPVNLRLELIRKINYIIDNKLFLRDNSPSSCGIDRFDYERGDEDDY